MVGEGDRDSSFDGVFFVSVIVGSGVKTCETVEEMERIDRVVETDNEPDLLKVKELVHVSVAE